ncbi:MAG: amidohydrolase family protein [bacterium]
MTRHAPSAPTLESCRALALRGATLIDGTGAAPLHRSVVILRNGRVEAVGTAELGIPGDAELLDVSGRWLLPGLIDAHVHARTEPHFKSLLLAGATALRNPAQGAPPSRTDDGQSTPPPHAPPRPRVISAGPPIDRAPSPWPEADQVTSEEELREAVRRQVADGVDLIKLYVRLTPPLVAAAVEEAHAAGVPVLGDLALTSWTDAARAGIDFLSHATPRHPSLLPADARDAFLAEIRDEHVDPLSRWFERVDLDGPEITEMITALADADVAVDPTLVAVRAQLTSSPHARVPEVWPKVLGLVRRLHQAGVRLLAGTDAPRPMIPAGASLHRELALLVDAGLSPTEALGAATGSSATALGLSADHGTITPGRRADLILLTADPLQDITNTESIDRILFAGEFLNRKTCGH